ncbi:hypothetical protein QQ020_17445 [Fulvivirgaceae bacterium BMA12]|uniref:Uncharacterized protein n=1 Tax=Agaribacillus aureus TaxID=3051825 RepID=A0ABT8L837_9BACT|nr:hypothetical protein [Fulvivirgaceae bacterium BMA12]
MSGQAILFSALVLFNTFHQSSLPDDHAIYIAVIQLEHQPNDITANLQVKVFTDDLQDALKNKFQGEIRLINVSENGEEAKRITAYFAGHLKFEINDQRADYQLQRITVENDAHWFDFTLKGPRKWDKLEVTADFLMELFPKQSNIFQVTEGDKRLYYRLTIGQKSQTITFSD